MADFRREIRFEPGHDCIRFECINGSDQCVPGGGGSHGISGLDIRFVLVGSKGAVQFVVGTSWLPEPQSVLGIHRRSSPYPSDLGYHAIEPQYEGQTEYDCEWTPSGRCFYDGSGLNADDAFRVLCNEGGDALWGFLERYYECVFAGAEYPSVKDYRCAARDPLLVKAEHRRMKAALAAHEERWEDA